MQKVVITDKEGVPYLTRYVLDKKPDTSGIYLHIIHQSDDDRSFHDHPFDFKSFILEGSYVEHTPSGSRRYSAGDWNVKKGSDFHRLELDSGPVTTILYRGPKYKEWGFLTDDGWKHHVPYLDEKFGPGNWGKEEAFEWKPPEDVVVQAAVADLTKTITSPAPSCNRHSNCYTARTECCHDECCEECFGN